VFGCSGVRQYGVNSRTLELSNARTLLAYIIGPG
jgi:hypothetical protein